MMSGGRETSLEVRLTQFFVLSMCVWNLLDTIISFAVGLPNAIIFMYLCNLLWIIINVLLGHIIHKVQLFKYIYLTSNLIIIPVMWFFLGAAEGSANILFVCLYVSMIMCFSGKVSNVYLIVSLILTPISQRLGTVVSRPEWLTMDQRQESICWSMVGLSTSVVIAALLIKLKSEYAKERDAAVESEKALEKSNMMQKNFLANMSHEIRSPLGIVLGFNDLISDSDDIECIHEYSRNINKAGRTLRAVINDILDYSKIDSGKLDIIDTDYSFDEMIEEIRTDIKLKAGEKGIKFILNVDNNIPHYLNGDCVRVRQCVLNILSNAVKYTSAGTITFEALRVDNSDDSICTIKFVVKDTGRGISKDAIPKLFDAFQRLDEGINRGIEGTGLGLSITKNLVDEMGGTIDVDSTLGVGTTFTIVLSQKVATNTKIMDESVIDDMDFTGKKALVVDDTKMNLTLISRFLIKFGMRSVVFDNGKDALADCVDNKYDIIFLDHMMPEMNGIEVFKRLKEMKGINEATPVIMLTANAMAGMSKEYLDLGFDGYVSKPIDVNKLKAEIAKVLNSEA